MKRRKPGRSHIGSEDFRGEGDAMSFTKTLRSFGRNWVYLPGVALMFLSLVVVLFPETLKWLVAGFFLVSGVGLIQATRAIRSLAQAFRARLADVILERPSSEKELDLFPPDPPLTWVN
jgi:hypothetical protein